MELTRSEIEDAAAEYEREEPLYPVEQEGIETLPTAFPDGEFGFRDAEWVVQWYYRRYLGAYPDEEQREGEARFGENDRAAVRAAVIDAANAGTLDDRITRLQELEAVDVPVASAFLQFIDPERHLAIDRRTWNVLYDAGELDEPYPKTPSIDTYRAFLTVCRRLAGNTGVDCWTLYRALWRLGGGN